MQALADSLQVLPGPCTLQTAPVDIRFNGHLKTGRQLTSDAPARVCKRIVTRAAQQLECAYPGGAADLRRASSHGLRHTHANHALDAGSDLRDVQTNLGMPVSARPLSIRKGMTPDATRPLMRSSRTRYQRAGRSGSCGTRLCALRMKINPAPARLDFKAGFLQNHQLFTSLVACLESRHSHVTYRRQRFRAPLSRVDRLKRERTKRLRPQLPSWEWPHVPPLDRLSMAIRPWAVPARMDGYPHRPANARPGRSGADDHALLLPRTASCVAFTQRWKARTRRGAAPQVEFPTTAFRPCAP
nr:tyrosine-type recombinase/integrase [Paraburkholderia terrae]